MDVDGALAPYGWGDRWRAAFAAVAGEWPGAVPGRVVRHDGSLVTVALATGIEALPVRPAAGAVAVGDWVAVAGSRVVAVLDRASLLRRQDPRAGEQLLAANVDVVAAVAGLDRPVKAGRIQRAVAQAWDAGAVPVVVLTKGDLMPDAAAVASRVEAENPGVDALVVSAPTGAGLEAMVERLAGRTSVLLGESGAGKSTLLNTLLGAEVEKTGRVRAGDAKGRHTTTARHLHLLPAAVGGAVIDTPGLRAVGLWADPDAVSAAFADVEEAAEGCRFRDCGHDREPGCAVRAAVASGALAEQRLASWIAMRREAEAAMLRADEAAHRRAQRRFGRMVKDASRRKGR